MFRKIKESEFTGDGVIVGSITLPVMFRGPNCWNCPQTLTKRFGSLYECRLFSESLGGSDSEHCLLIDDRGLIVRHPKCICANK